MPPQLLVVTHEQADLLEVPEELVLVAVLEAFHLRLEVVQVLHDTEDFGAVHDFGPEH